MSHSTLISIITVTYNADRFLRNTIQSVINQTYRSIEYIIIDGNSTDNTIDIINSFKGYLSNIIIEKDDGVYDAMNKGLKVATGEWILFLNAGDVLANDLVLNTIFSIDSHDEYVAIYGNWINNNRGQFITHTPKPFFSFSKLPLNSGICHQSIFVKAKYAKTINFDYKTYKISADYDMMLRLYAQYKNFYYINTDICIYETSYGLSARNRLLALKECAKITNREHCLEYYHLYIITLLKKIVSNIIFNNKIFKCLHKVKS